MFSGYKTYATAIVAVLYALYCHFAGSTDAGSLVPAMGWPETIKTILAAAAVMGLRSGLNTGILTILAGMGLYVSKATPLQAKMARSLKSAREGVGRAVPVLVVGLLLTFSPFLSGCAIGGVKISPQQTLEGIAASFAIAEAGYDTICAINSPPAFCVENAASYAKAKKLVTDALNAAQAAISLSGGVDSAAIEQLLVALQHAYTDFNEKQALPMKARYAKYQLEHH